MCYGLVDFYICIHPVNHYPDRDTEKQKMCMKDLSCAWVLGVLFLEAKVSNAFEILLLRTQKKKNVVLWNNQYNQVTFSFFFFILPYKFVSPSRFMEENDFIYM